MPEKSVFGLSPNGAAALSYVLGPLTGIAVMVLERSNKFVRFHALQSTLWFLMLWIARWAHALITGVPLVGNLLGIVLSPVFFIGVLLYFGSKFFLIWRAYQGTTFKIPIFGDVAWSQVNK